MPPNTTNNRHSPDEPTEEQWARAWRCWLLAPTLAIYEALLKGERVPVDQLDPEGVRRLWKRPA